MRAALAGGCVGFVAGLAWGWPRAASGPAVGSDDGAGPSPAADPAVVWEVPDAITPGATPAARPFDLARWDELFGVLVGDPMPWDDPTEPDRMTASLREGGRALAAAGSGRLVGLDCASRPCLATIEAEGRPQDLDALVAAAEAHFPGMRVWQVDVSVPVEERVVNLVLLEQAVDDVPPGDPTLLVRKDDLRYDAMAPPIPPDAPAAVEPLVWPEAWTP